MGVHKRNHNPEMSLTTPAPMRPTKVRDPPHSLSSVLGTGPRGPGVGARVLPRVPNLLHRDTQTSPGPTGVSTVSGPSICVGPHVWNTDPPVTCPTVLHTGGVGRVS